MDNLITGFFKYCFWFTAHPLSRDGIIAIGSSICVFIVTSILFSLAGYFCRRKQQQETNTPANIYQSVQLKNNTKALDLEANVAYASVQEIKSQY